MGLFGQPQQQPQQPMMIVPEQEQEQQQQYPQQFMQNPDKANLLHEMDPTAIVERINHELLGERLNSDGTWTKNKFITNIPINEVGVHDIATLILSICSQNMILSNLDENDIKLLAHENVETAMVMFRNNWYRYGFKRSAGKGELYLLKQIIYNLTYSTLKQAQAEGIRKLLKSTTTELRQTNTMEKPQASLLNMIWKRR